MRATSGGDAETTSNSTRTFSRPIFSGCDAGPAEIDLFSNLASCSVFDLSVVHLHPLIAPHIITKFFAWGFLRFCLPRWQPQLLCLHRKPPRHWCPLSSTRRP